MYWPHNEGKPVATDERFIKTLINKVYKCMTLVS